MQIPYFARQELLLDYRLMVKPDSNCRICASHLNGNHLKPDLAVIQANSDVSCELTTEEAAKFIEYLLSSMKEMRETPHLDFEGGKLSDEDYRLWTGWTKEQFDSFIPCLIGMRNTKSRTLRESLAMFWIKLKTDLSFAQIASLFNIPDPGEGGRHIVSDAFHAVQDKLSENFVPSWLGCKHMDPNVAKKHNTVYSKTFFGDHPTTIWDGTYLYIHKSMNYSKGRKTYCVYKHRHLVKFMSIVLPDGYVLETLGPYFSDGKNNDAGMTADIIKDLETGMRDWLLEVDPQTVVVDRGFRNVLSDLDALGNVQTKMPSCEAKGNSQHSVSEANSSRLVTKVRWVVEAYHGRFKKFKLFENRQCTSFLPSYRKCLRILTAALNAFRPVLYNTATNAPFHQEIADRMMDLSRATSNPLAERVSKGELSNRGRKWTAAETTPTASELLIGDPIAVPDFPRLQEEDICKSITCGTYQIEQAKHYTDEHSSSEGGFDFYVHKSAPDLVRVRLQSRHKNATKYFVWVQFLASHESSPGKITGWFCQCKSGQRVVGCCAHVATVIWFLGYARHKGYKVSPKLDKFWRNVLDSGDGFADSDEEEAPEN